MSDTPKVQFSVAGVQKGGTTALFDYLSEHPDFLLPAIKEVHFFDDESQDWSAPDYRRYHAHFVQPQDGRRRLWGEATPIYGYWPNSLERVAAYNPDMRLIFIFRDPVERAWSHWKMEFARGAEAEPFAWCIRQGRERINTDPTTPGHHRVYSYVERGFYGAQVQRAKRLFPARQLLFLRSEDLKRQPERVLGAVCDFLDAPRLKSIVQKTSHTAKDIDYGCEITQADRKYMDDIFLEDKEVFFQETGIRGFS